MLSLAAAAVALVLQAPVPTGTRGEAPVSVLQQIADGWDDLTPKQRDRAMRNYRSYMDLPAEKRRDVDQRYEKWKKLPRDDRDRFRKKHERYRGRGLDDD